ncbi:hypothetical protein B0T11DRAFT_104513 [Plectosphaerella cucumerina]|uniref:Uncharacterized protein n=1 Tax=Plectosphaerella cucumerina TaxID=40658 RepID=A0A8K0X2I2_9PEZI|nr:hypothetical protein B0T11DRAFT_104513 [Plectosphaerella cucumerina]
MHDKAQPKGGCLFGRAAVQTRPHGYDAATRETGVSQNRPSGKGARQGTCYVHTICRNVSLEPNISRPAATHPRSRALGRYCDRTSPTDKSWRAHPLVASFLGAAMAHHDTSSDRTCAEISQVTGQAEDYSGASSSTGPTGCGVRPSDGSPARPLGLFQVPRVRRAPRDATPPVRGFVKGNRQTRPSKAPPFGRLTPTPRPLIDTAQLLGNLRELVAVVHGQSSVATLQPVRPGWDSLDCAKGCSLHLTATLQSL